jgi:ubiquinone/menaquinone biosynthesis C-methylase UbiE
VKGNYRGKTHYQSETVAEEYDAIRFTSWKGRLVDRLEKAFVLRALRGLPPGARVLDLPAGTGRITELLRGAGYATIGADISAAMLARGRLRGLAMPLLAADAEQLPFADGSFDAVVSVRLMHHVPSPIRCRMLAEFRRVSCGTVVATYADVWTIQAQWRRFRSARNPSLMPIFPATGGQVAKEAELAGLHIVDDTSLLPIYASTRLFRFAPTERSN